MNAPLQGLVIEYRSPERTTACVNALLGQGLRMIHIVDNSADEGRTRSRLHTAFAEDARVRILDAGCNLGFAGGVNFGLRHRTCERVLLINNDAIPAPNTTEALNAALDAEPSACLAFPSLIHAGQPVGRVFYHRWLAVLTDRSWPGSFELPRGCCMLVALDRIPIAPLFDTKFFMYGEEIALGWHLHKAGARILHVDSALVEHEGSATAVRGSAFYEERTALAHILLNDVVTNGPMQRALIGAVRNQAIMMRTLIRALRQRSTLPLRALLRAREMARCTNDGSAGSPPPR